MTTETTKTFDQLLDEGVASMRAALAQQGIAEPNTMMPPALNGRMHDPELVVRALVDGDGSAIPKDGPTTYGGRFLIDVPAEGDKPESTRTCAFIRTVWSNGAVRDNVMVHQPEADTVETTPAPVQEAEERTGETQPDPVVETEAEAPPAETETTVTEEIADPK